LKPGFARINAWLPLASIAFQSSQPLFGIFDFRESGIGVFPEGEEFCLVLDGFGFGAFLFI